MPSHEVGRFGDARPAGGAFTGFNASLPTDVSPVDKELGPAVTMPVHHLPRPPSPADQGILTIAQPASEAVLVSGFPIDEPPYPHSAANFIRIPGINDHGPLGKADRGIRDIYYSKPHATVAIGDERNARSTQVSQVAYRIHQEKGSHSDRNWRIAEGQVDSQIHAAIVDAMASQPQVRDASYKTQSGEDWREKYHWLDSSAPLHAPTSQKEQRQGTNYSGVAGPPLTVKEFNEESEPRQPAPQRSKSKTDNYWLNLYWPPIPLPPLIIKTPQEDSPQQERQIRIAS